MLIAPLGSGSGGNCTYFESDGTSILVDAGFSARETERRLAAIGQDIEAIKAIVVTHEHSDHIHGAGRIAQKFQIPIYLTKGTLDASNIDVAETPVHVIANNSSVRIGDLQVHARRTMHDASDPACYVIEAGDGTRVGIASDLGCVDRGVMQHLSHCDGLLFESNHDLDMLREGSYPWSLKRRIMSNVGHLSNDDAMAAIERLIGPELQSLCLIHLSDKNNHENLVRQMVTETLRRVGAKLHVAIARQEAPTALLEVSRRHGAPPRLSQQLSLF